MLRQLGYEVKLYGKGGKPLAHPTIEPQGSERYFRLDRLGEGNTSDTCAERWYPIGYYEILGYGVLCP